MRTRLRPLSRYDGNLQRASVLRTVMLASLVSASVQVAVAQTPQAMIRVGDMPSGLPVGDVVSDIRLVAGNRGGGYAFLIDSTGSADLSHYFGHGVGGPGTLLRTERTIGGFEQDWFDGMLALGGSGELIYGAFDPSAIDSVWLDDTLVLKTGDPVPAIPGQYWEGAGRARATQAGEPIWVGFFGPTAGGVAENAGLFAGTSGTPLLVGGTWLPNLPYGLRTDSSVIDLNFGASGDGNSYITVVQMDAPSEPAAMVVDGQGLVIDGTLVRAGNTIPPSAGGRFGETYRNLNHHCVNEAGDILFGGWSSIFASDDAYVMKNSQIIHREGEPMDGAILAHTLDAMALNEDGDYAFRSHVSNSSGGNDPVVVLNGEILLRKGGQVDWDGDGVAEYDSRFNRHLILDSLELSDRDSDGKVSVHFIAEVDHAGGAGVAGLSLKASTRLMRLRSNLEVAATGDDLELKLTKGEPGGLAYVYLLTIDGAPLFLRLFSGNFDAVGSFVVSFTVPAGLAGTELVLVAFGQPAGLSKYRVSCPITIRVQ